MLPNSSKDPKVGPRMKTKKEESWGMFPNSQHFRGRKVCWSSEMGLGQTHKRKFNMRSTCTTKKRGQLVQVEWKWCDGLSKDNLKHKLYTTYNLCEETPLPFS
jgi:hypothetical protein